jgi:valyl-tRNA synthetase
MIKPAYQKPIDKATFDSTIIFFEELMKILHPFMPFITEEIWHLLGDRDDKDCIIVATMPESKAFDKTLLESFSVEEQAIIAIRNLRKNKGIPNKEPIELFVKKNNNQKADHTFDDVISKLCNISEIKYTDEKIEGAASFIVKSTEFYVPLGDNVDIEAEIAKLEEELKYTQGFLNSVAKKLSNERFVNNAPAAVVDKEKKKQSDAESRIKVIEEQLKGLGKS